MKPSLRLSLAAAIGMAPAALGFAALLLTNPYDDGFRISVSGDGAYSDRCLVEWLRREHPAFAAGSGATRSYAFELSLPTNAGATKSRVGVSVAKRALDVSVSWSDGPRAPADLDRRLKDALTGLSAACGVESWTASCTEASPGAGCPAFCAR